MGDESNYLSGRYSIQIQHLELSRPCHKATIARLLTETFSSFIAHLFSRDRAAENGLEPRPKRIAGACPDLLPN